MKKFIAKFWRANPQLKNGGYETTRTIEARGIASAGKKANRIADSMVYGSMSLLSIEEVKEAEAPVEAALLEVAEEAAPTAKKLYSAMVKDGKRVVIIRDQDYPNKAAFIRDLRVNGYKVNPKKVKPSDVFDYICDHTDMNPWDWDLKKVPEEVEEGFLDWDPAEVREALANSDKSRFDKMLGLVEQEEPTTHQEEQSEEVPNSKLNPMCEKCANFPTDCAGTHEQVWTGCVHRETAPGENRTFAPPQWTDYLEEAVYNRICNCKTLRADVPALVSAKWRFYTETGKDKSGLTKEDALVSVLELLDSNSSTIEITSEEYAALCS